MIFLFTFFIKKKVGPRWQASKKNFYEQPYIGLPIPMHYIGQHTPITHMYTSKIQHTNPKPIQTLAPTYCPANIEDKWYDYWQQHDFFRSAPHPTKKPYAMVMPPPNITGVLHMGHMLNNTLQDVLVRKARMQGREACWVPGTDHAAIATEAKITAMLQAKGLQKQTIGREAFLTHAWQWKEKYGNIILAQLKKLGASCDWSRTRFTLEQNLSEAVTEVFVKLYEQGYVYRGTRMINWDPQGKTALADDEVIHQSVAGKLYYIRYALEGSDAYVTVATTRPETILADTALCVHPKDTRYAHYIGKKVGVPLVHRAVPIIADEYVRMDFGTGCLKVTPAHDVNDDALGQKHQLPYIDIFNEDGTLNKAAGLFAGEDRFVARKKIVQAVDQAGYLEKIEDYTHTVGFSERTQAVVEPRRSAQWFVKMKALAQPALDHVRDGTIRFYPDKLKNTYKAWLEKVKDWCISRQLWWGHRIPAYYLPDGTIVVAHNKPAALAKAQALPHGKKLMEKDLQQDNDVLDTWFSSWLWPITVFDGFKKKPNNPDLRYYYPTHDLVTGPDIIFFWVARMIMAGYAFQGQPPFKNVYFTGIVRDKAGKKMAKSLGNSPDPLALIKQYGADAVRAGLLFSAPAGNDLLFNVKLCEQGKNFTNKIWNALRLVKAWAIHDKEDEKNDQLAMQWFKAKFQQALQTIEDHFEKFRISDALLTLYKLIWDDFCAGYLEMIKPAYGKRIGKTTYETTLEFFENLMKVLHPFMPFITEEIFHQLKERTEKVCIMVAAWPQCMPFDAVLLEQATCAFEVIGQVRKVKNQKKIDLKQTLTLYSPQPFSAWLKKFSQLIKKLARLDAIATHDADTCQGVTFSVAHQRFCLPLVQPTDLVEEKESLLKALAYQKDFLALTRKKLGNERFMQNATKQVIALTRKKEQSALMKIAMLEEQLKKV